MPIPAAQRCIPELHWGHYTHDIVLVHTHLYLLHWQIHIVKRHVSLEPKKGVLGAVYWEAEAKELATCSNLYGMMMEVMTCIIALLFCDYQSCPQFRSFLSHWYLNNPLVDRCWASSLFGFLKVTGGLCILLTLVVLILWFSTSSTLVLYTLRAWIFVTMIF